MTFLTALSVIMGWSVVLHTVLYFLTISLSSTAKVEEKHHKSLLERSQDIIRVADAEESLYYKKDLPHYHGKLVLTLKYYYMKLKKKMSQVFFIYLLIIFKIKISHEISYYSK